MNENDFDDTNGRNPYGSLVQGDDGKLYGITAFGGTGYISRQSPTGDGVVFSFDPSKSFFTKLTRF